MPAGSFVIARTAADQGGGMVYVVPVTINGSTASYIVNQSIDLLPVTSDNTVSVSTAGTAVLIQPSANFAGTLTLKSSVGATPFPISNANPTLLSFTSAFPATNGNFVLSAGTSAGSTTLSEINLTVI
jgi:hypothetical protein